MKSLLLIREIIKKEELMPKLSLTSKGILERARKVCEELSENPNSMAQDAGMKIKKHMDVLEKNFMRDLQTAENNGKKQGYANGVMSTQNEGLVADLRAHGGCI